MRKKMTRTMISLLCAFLTLFLTACSPTKPTNTTVTTTFDNSNTTTTHPSTTTTITASQTTVPSTASLSIYSQADTDAVEIIDLYQSGKRCMVTEPEQLNALFELFGNTSGEYLGDTVKGIYGATRLALRLYNQGEEFGHIQLAGHGDMADAYFAIDRYREWDTDTVRYYESRYSLTAVQMQEFLIWAKQFSYA